MTQFKFIEFSDKRTVEGFNLSYSKREILEGRGNSKDLTLRWKVAWKKNIPSAKTRIRLRRYRKSKKNRTENYKTWF